MYLTDNVMIMVTFILFYRMALCDLDIEIDIDRKYLGEVGACLLSQTHTFEGRYSGFEFYRFLVTSPVGR